MRTPVKALATVVLVIGAFLGGSWHARRSLHAEAAPPARRVLYWTCPMHPDFKSDRPGDAPCCGMRLQPVYDRPNVAVWSPPAPPSVTAGAQARQLIGLRTARVERSTASHALRTLGRVAADENRVYRLNTSTELWVRKVHPATAGSTVHKDEPLLEFYTTNFFSAAAAYLYALDTRDRQVKSGQNNEAQNKATGFQVRQAVESLQNLSVSDTDIQEMERTRRAPNLVTLRSPADGYVLARNIGLGQWVPSATELYRIADLSRVWVLADFFENEAQFIKPGQSATVKYQGRNWKARMSDVLPQFDPAARVMKVRFEVDNPGYILRPDMFVDLEYPVQLSQALFVPADAVIDTGAARTVYVERGEGLFEPRRVETGWRSGDRIAIVNGLAEGERVVVGGSFLIDSESRMKRSGMPEGPAAGTVRDPVCGMDVDPAKALKVKLGGGVYYFCSDRCKREFEKKKATLRASS